MHREINGCWDMDEFYILLCTRVTLQYALKGQYASYTFIYISLACVVTISVNSVGALLVYYWGKSSDSSCCDIHWISNTFSGFVMKSYCFAQKMADMHFVCGHANWNSWEAHCLYTEQYPQHRTPSHKLFTKFTSNWVNLGPFAPWLLDNRRPQWIQTPNLKVCILWRVD
jgi:hypothetical protein